MKLCRDYYQVAKEAVFSYSGIDFFGAGFMLGQVEKVFLGACNAAMFRIVGDKLQIKYLEHICKIYSLNVQIMDEEVWVYKHRLRWLIAEKGTPKYHMLRAADCGIPTERIDLEWPG